MNIYYLHTLIMTASEIYCCILLFQSFAKKREKNNKGIRAFAIVCAQLLIGVTLSLVLDNHFYIKIVLILMEMSVAMFFMFRIHYLKSFILTLFFLGLGILTECATLIFLGWLFPVIAGRPYDFNETFAVNAMAVISELLLFLCVLLVKKIMGHKTSTVLTKREWGIIFAISIISLSSITEIVLDIDLLHNSKQSNLIYIIIGLLIINFIVYYLITDIMKRELKLREYAVFQEKVKNETNMYHSISENLEKQQKRTHEYKNQIVVIRAFLSDGHYQEAKDYIETIDESLKFDMDTIDTNHVIINAILNTKYKEAVGQGIVFVLKVNDLSQLDMSEEDIVIILSNLLNNAIEACRKCKEKIIKFKFILEKGQAVISVINSVADKPVVENGKYLTTKTEERQEHGFGILNVIEAIKRYDGRYFIECEKDEFQFSIVIPFPNMP